MPGYLGKYIRLYVWLTISFVLNFLSLFIVTPLLTSNPVIYGIYVLCISTSIFLQYADLGFVGAGFKFASESHIRGEEGEVVRIVGFVTAILLVFVVIFSAAMVYLSGHPDILIKNISSDEQRLVARRLFATLAAFAPAIVLQRSIQILFGVRVEDYLIQRILDRREHAQDRVGALFFPRRALQHRRILHFFPECRRLVRGGEYRAGAPSLRLQGS